jgi:hypothetical protein
MTTKCACGCEIFLPIKKYYGKTRIYIQGHNRKGKINFEKMKKTKAKRRTSHVAHLDGNPFNNNINNLTCLCVSHHRILDNKKISLNELLKLKLNYYEDNSGKRRYEWL